VTPKGIVKIMESTVARELKMSVRNNVSGLVLNACATTIHAKTTAAATETAETFPIEILVKTTIVIGGVVNAVSPLSALGAATTTATATSARTRAAHGMTTLVIAVWCAESLTTKAAAIARGVDTVIGTVTTEAISEELAKSSPVTTMTILAAASARAIPIISALIKTAADVADLPIAKKRR
jgi:hypothetical protein